MSTNFHYRVKDKAILDALHAFFDKLKAVEAAGRKFAKLFPGASPKFYNGFEYHFAGVSFYGHTNNEGLINVPNDSKLWTQASSGGLRRPKNATPEGRKLVKLYADNFPKATVSMRSWIKECKLDKLIPNDFSQPGINIPPGAKDTAYLVVSTAINDPRFEEILPSEWVKVTSQKKAKK